MICLDKHLGHLKKENQGLQGSGGILVKEDEISPTQSPATLSTNWNSPAQLQGPSPVTSHMSHDDYASAMRHQGHPQYGAIDGSSGPYNHHSSTPHTPLTAGPYPTHRQQQPGQSHRRQVSDMSGGDDQHIQAKRQQMHPPHANHVYQRQ